MDTVTVPIGDALFTKTQQKVLGLLFGTPDKRFYTNEIMRWADMGRGTVSRELSRLVSAGLLTATSEGNQNHYQANPSCPVFDELVAIVRKTFGVADVIRERLKPLDDNIELAFIYGSIAKGEATSASDIDLMLVGKALSYGQVMELLMPLENALRRTLNPTLFEKEDFVAKLKTGNSFVTRVMEQSKIMIKGNENDFRQTG
jgi:predicted nucleotidyltransferase